MSYAAVTAKNAPPESELPQPSQDLLDGHFAGETEASIPDVDSKIAVVDHDWKDHPSTTTSLHLNNDPSNPSTVPHHPAPIDTDPHVSSVAPTPISSEQAAENFEKREAEAEAAAKEVADKAEAKAKKLEKEAEKKGKELKADAKELASKAEKESKELYSKGKKEAKELYKKGKEELDEVEGVLAKYFEKSKDVVLRPGVLGGLMGVVNIGILSTLGYYAYTNPSYKTWDKRIVSASIAGTLALFTAEGFVAEKYIDTPEGREEAARAKAEGSRLYRQGKEIVLRPGVAGGLLGVVNIGILGTIGYFSYNNWQKPTWDRRIVGGVVAGLVALTGVEGALGKYYADHELPKRK